MSNTPIINRLIVKDQDLLLLTTCEICKDILFNPYDCSDCNNTYCYTCISDSKCIKCETEKPNINKSSLKLIKFIETLKFSCCNKAYGCNEDMSYLDLKVHTCKVSPLSARKNNSWDRHMSFSNCKLYNDLDLTVGECKDNNENTLNGNNILSQKLDKILDIINFFQGSINKNIFQTPQKEFLSETPKFSMGFGNRLDADSHILKDNTFIQQLHQEKIISELEIINEKITSLENNLNGDKFKKIIENEISNAFEKINNSIATTNFSSLNNSANNSLILSKSLSTSKLKSLKTETSKKSFKNIQPINNNNKSPKTASIINSNLKINKVIKDKDTIDKQDKTNYGIKKINSRNKIPDINTNYIQFNTLSDNIKSSFFDNFDRNEDKYLSTIKNLESNLEHVLEKYLEDLKLHLDNKLLDELKTSFIEVTLDSNSLIINKIEDLLSIKETNV